MCEGVKIQLNPKGTNNQTKYKDNWQITDFVMKSKVISQQKIFKILFLQGLKLF